MPITRRRSARTSDVYKRQFLTSLLVCVVVSLVTPAPSKEIEAEFEAAK